MDLEGVIAALNAARAAADLYLEEHPNLPRSNALSIGNGIGQTRFLLTALQRARGAEEAQVAKEATRAVVAAQPRYDQHEIDSTARLIASGQLPAGSTPADFIALQEQRRAEMRGKPRMGGVPRPEARA